MNTALHEIGRLLPVVGFLAAVLVLAKLCDDEGLFHAAGIYMARHSWGAGQSAARRLLTTVFLIAAGTTAVLSLDATVVLLTPVVLSTARTLGVPARPHGYAAAHLANTASLLLPVSNLTNLLAFSTAGLSFTRFTAAMTLPWLLAVAAEYVLLRLLFRRELRIGAADRVAPPPPEVPYFVLTVLILTLIGFGATSLLGFAPAWAAFAGAAVLAVRAVVRRLPVDEAENQERHRSENTERGVAEEHPQAERRRVAVRRPRPVQQGHGRQVDAGRGEDGEHAERRQQQDAQPRPDGGDVGGGRLRRPAERDRRLRDVRRDRYSGDDRLRANGISRQGAARQPLRDGGLDGPWNALHLRIDRHQRRGQQRCFVVDRSPDAVHVSLDGYQWRRE